MSNDVTMVRDGDVIEVKGFLGIETVGRLRESGAKLIDEVDSPVVDLSGCTVKGSAVISLLIAWQRHALRRGKSLEFVEPSANLMEIAKACGVQSILAFGRGEGGE